MGVLSPGLAGVRVLGALFFALLIGATSARAQPPGPSLSIEQLAMRVLEGNRDMQAALTARDAARAGARASQALPNPRLDLSSGRSVPRLGVGPSGAVQGFGAAQLIENPDARGARIDLARAQERSAEQGIALTRNDLVAQVRLGAYEALLRQEEADLAEESLRLLEQIRERIRVRVDSGEAARYEIIKADAEIVGARQRRDAARLSAQKALLEINRLAGGRLSEGWQLSARLDDPGPSLSLQGLTEEALARSPELALLRIEIDRARAQLQAARASRWPGIEVRIEHAREPDLVQNRIGVSVAAPLLDSRERVVEQASFELTRAQQLLDGRMAELRQQVLLGWKALEIAAGAVESLSRGAVREAEAALRVAEAAHRFGERGILEVLDAQRVLRAVRADLLQARYQLQVARVGLEHLAARHASP